MLHLQTWKRYCTIRGRFDNNNTDCFILIPTCTYPGDIVEGSRRITKIRCTPTPRLKWKPQEATPNTKSVNTGTCITSILRAYRFFQIPKYPGARVVLSNVIGMADTINWSASHKRLSYSNSQHKNSLVSVHELHSLHHPYCPDETIYQHPKLSSNKVPRREIFKILIYTTQAPKFAIKV